MSHTRCLAQHLSVQPLKPFINGGHFKYLNRDEEFFVFENQSRQTKAGQNYTILIFLDIFIDL